MGATTNSDSVGNEQTSVQDDETRLRELREFLGKVEGDPLRVVGVGAGAWGSVFLAMLQNTYGSYHDSIQVNNSTISTNSLNSLISNPEHPKP